MSATFNFSVRTKKFVSYKLNRKKEKPNKKLEI